MGMAISLDPGARKRRIEEREAERAKIGPPAQPLRSLSALGERLIIIDDSNSCDRSSAKGLASCLSYGAHKAVSKKMPRLVGTDRGARIATVYGD
jgi:hypothetical protein